MFLYVCLCFLLNDDDDDDNDDNRHCNGWQKKTAWSTNIVMYFLYWYYPILLTYQVCIANNTHLKWLWYQHAFSANYQTYFGSCLYLLMPFYYRHDCLHTCRVWYALFEQQMKYYTLFRVLRWEFASVYIYTHH